MNRLIAACLLPAVLSGCAIKGEVQGLGQQIGPAVGAIDADIFSIAVAKYHAAQMFKAQIDGTLQLPDLPPPPAPVSAPAPPPPAPVTPPIMTPTPMPPTPTPSGPGGPIVTPNRRS